MQVKSKIFGWFTTFFFGAACVNLYAQQDFSMWVQADLAGLTLENTAMYPDSSFFANPIGTVMAESMVRVRKRSRQMHDDDTQKQQFYWFEIETERGEKGWIFGDALAFSVPSHQLPPKARALHKSFQLLKEPLGRSQVWFAKVEGQDKQDAGFSNYAEYFLAFTQVETGKTIFVIVGHQNQYSSSTFYDVTLEPVSDENFPDIIIHSVRSDADAQYKEFQIKKQQRLQWDNIYQTDDRLEDSEPPFTSKDFNLEPPFLRTEYIRGSFKNQWFASLPKNLDPRTVFLRLGSKTEVYRPLNVQFETLYAQSETTLKGRAKKNLSLRERIHAAPFANLPMGAEVIIYGVIRERNFFLVGYKDKIGYVPVNDVEVTTGWLLR